MGKYLLNYQTNSEFVEKEKKAYNTIVDYVSSARVQYDVDDISQRELHMYVDEETNTLVCATTLNCSTYGDEPEECYENQIMPPTEPWDWTDSAQTPISNVIPGEGNIIIFHTAAEITTKKGQAWGREYDRDYLGTFVPSGEPLYVESALSENVLAKIKYYTQSCSLRGIVTSFVWSGETYTYKGELATLPEGLSSNYKYEWTAGNKSVYFSTIYPIQGTSFMRYTGTGWGGGSIGSASTTVTIEKEIFIPVEYIETYVDDSGVTHTGDLIDDFFVETGQHPIYLSLEDMVVNPYVWLNDAVTFGYKMGKDMTSTPEWVSSVKPGVAYVNETKNVYYNYHAISFPITVEYFYNTRYEEPFTSITFSNNTITADDIFAPFCEQGFEWSTYPGFYTEAGDYYSFTNTTGNTGTNYYDGLLEYISTHEQPISFTMENYKFVFNNKMKGKKVKIYNDGYEPI